MSEQVFQLNGRNGQAIIYNDKVVISRKGAKAKFLSGAAGDKTIPMSSIQTVSYKPRSVWAVGYIQFGTVGSKSVMNVTDWSIQIVYEYRYVCPTCGWYMEDVDGISSSDQLSYLMAHQQIEHGKRGNYYAESVNVGVTGEWIVDSSAYDETVTDWSTTYCARCGQKYGHEHEYEDPIFIWSEDGTELEAMFVCSMGDDVQIVKGVVTSYEVVAINEDQPREATSTRDGQYISNGYVVFNGKTYYADCGSIIPAYGT